MAKKVVSKPSLLNDKQIQGCEFWQKKGRRKAYVVAGSNYAFSTHTDAVLSISEPILAPDQPYNYVTEIDLTKDSWKKTELVLLPSQKK